MNTEQFDGHTPGPWVLDEGCNGDLLITSTHDSNGPDDDVCLVYGGNDGERRTEDARLIAAAPELKRLLDLLSRAVDVHIVVRQTEWDEKNGAERIVIHTDGGGAGAWCATLDVGYRNEDGSEEWETGGHAVEWNSRANPEIAEGEEMLRCFAEYEQYYPPGGDEE